MRFLVIILFLAHCGGITFAQELSVKTGTLPAECRTSPQQFASGVIYAEAEGGVPPYSYQWQDMVNGPLQTTNNNVSGQIAGLYVVTVTDSIGDQVSDTLVLDSISPAPDFEIISNDLTFDNGIYVGFEKAKIECVNANKEFLAVPFPPPDHTYFWNLNANIDEHWTPKYNYEELDTTYAKGLHHICLAETNYNGCSDTLCKTIQILEFKNNIGSIYTNQGLDEITITNPTNKEDLKIMIYSISGQLVLDHILNGPIDFLTFNVAKGVYIFQFINTSNGDCLSAGKFLN